MSNTQRFTFLVKLKQVFTILSFRTSVQIPSADSCCEELGDARADCHGEDPFLAALGGAPSLSTAATGGWASGAGMAKLWLGWGVGEQNSASSFWEETRNVGWSVLDDLVGGLEHVLFFHILGIRIQTDFHIFQMG